MFLCGSSFAIEIVRVKLDRGDFPDRFIVLYVGISVALQAFEFCISRKEYRLLPKPIGTIRSALGIAYHGVISLLQICKLCP